jgi:hypothetical protein
VTQDGRLLVQWSMTAAALVFLLAVIVGFCDENTTFLALADPSLLWLWGDDPDGQSSSCRLRFAVGSRVRRGYQSLRLSPLPPSSGDALGLLL